MNFQDWLESVKDWTPNQDDPAYLFAMGEFITDNEVDPLGFDSCGVPDWLPHYISSQMGYANDIERERDLGLQPIIEMAEKLKVAPTFIPGCRLAGIKELNAQAVIEGLLPLDEFRTACLPMDAARFNVIWRATKWTSGGFMIMGTCKPTPKKTKGLWQGPGVCPHWDMTLSLPAWLLMDDHERERLVHHEMGHAYVLVSETGKETPKGRRGHEMEEFSSTITRYGLERFEQVGVASAIIEHEGTGQKLRDYDFDVQGQGLLFDGPGLRVVNE